MIVFDILYLLHKTCQEPIRPPEGKQKYTVLAGADL